MQYGVGRGIASFENGLQRSQNLYPECKGADHSPATITHGRGDQDTVFQLVRFEGQIRIRASQPHENHLALQSLEEG
jgi:hypothetical protein